MSDGMFCAGCHRDGENTSAGSWCSDCGELVCNTCAKFHKKLSPPHAIIPIEKAQNLSSPLFELSKKCEQHPDQKIVLFCCQHDRVLCDACMSESHEGCNPIISIEKAAKGVKSGVATFDLEKRMENICQVIEKILGEQIKYKEDFHMSRKDIKTKISEIKTRGIAHLNQLEETLVDDLDKLYKEHEVTFIEGENNLQSMLESVSSSLTDFKSLKPNSTEIHLFQAVKYLDAKTCQQEVEVRKIQTRNLPKLEIQTQKDFLNLKNCLQSLGKVIIAKEPMQMSAVLCIDQQGQALARPKSDKKRLSFFTAFQASKLYKYAILQSGCFIPDNRLVLCSSCNQTIYVCNLDGSNVFSVELQYNPCAVARYDNNKALVTSHRRFIQNFDLDTLKLGSSFGVGVECKGIACVNESICVRDNFSSLSMVDTDGIERRKISTTADPLYLSMNKASEIFFTTESDDNVYMTTYYGVERVFYNHTDLKGPSGIVVDDNGGAVYVAGRKSNNIHRISSDGQEHGIVLDEKDGIQEPEGLSCNDLTKQIMIVNDSGVSIQIYKIQ